jgi:hypothetical protein
MYCRSKLCVTFSLFKFRMISPLCRGCNSASPLSAVQCKGTLSTMSSWLREDCSAIAAIVRSGKLFQNASLCENASDVKVLELKNDVLPRRVIIRLCSRSKLGLVNSPVPQLSTPVELEKCKDTIPWKISWIFVPKPFSGRALVMLCAIIPLLPDLTRPERWPEASPKSVPIFFSTQPPPSRGSLRISCGSLKSSIGRYCVVRTVLRSLTRLCMVLMCCGFCPRDWSACNRLPMFGVGWLLIDLSKW